MKSLRDSLLSWGRCPQTPGIYRLGARMTALGGGRSRPRPFRRLSRRSGCVPAWPYPPLRYFQSGSHQPRRSILLQPTATTPLTDCLTIGVHSGRPAGSLRPAPSRTKSVAYVLGIKCYLCPGLLKALAGLGCVIAWDGVCISRMGGHGGPPLQMVQTGNMGNT